MPRTPKGTARKLKTKFRVHVSMIRSAIPGSTWKKNEAARARETHKEYKRRYGKKPPKSWAKKIF